MTTPADPRAIKPQPTFLRVRTRPTAFTWLLLFISPFPILLGAVLYRQDPLWSVLFVAAGIFAAVNSGRVIWLWRTDNRQRAGQTSMSPVQPASTVFVGTDVAWGPAHLQAGMSIQRGWLVVRPQWVAFLPSEAPENLAFGMAMAAAGLGRVELGSVTYDFGAAFQEGPQSFDRQIFHLAQQGGRLLHMMDGDVVLGDKGVTFRGAGNLTILGGIRPPDALLAGWRIGKIEFNPRETARVLAILTSIPAGIAVICGVAGFVKDDSELLWGAAFWGALVVLAWAAYTARYVLNKR